MSQDGADAMKNLYNFFSDKNKKIPNYLKLFSENGKKKASNPVIFVFDNELSNKRKPLYSFVSHADLSSKKELLQKDLCVKVLDNGNLFLVTNPLMPGEKESEIELLFDDSTRNHIINGKIFSLDNKYDKKIFYGKDIFSNYILSNYQQINFDNFKPMLSNFVSVINNYSNEH